MALSNNPVKAPLPKKLRDNQCGHPFMWLWRNRTSSRLSQTLLRSQALLSIFLLYILGATMEMAITVGIPPPSITRESAQSAHRRKQLVLRKRRAELLGEEDGSIPIIDFHHPHPHNNNVSHVLDFKEYSLEDMVAATHSFHPSNLLGEGSNGQVFRGVLYGEEIAVKRLPVFAGKIAEEEQLLVEEIRRIGAVNHRNIMQLLGFCLQGESPLLVSKKLYSLEAALYEDRRLNWGARFQIAVDVAKALAYLHSGTRVQMVHCDIKPGNILLDRDTLQAYIADFGLVHLGRGQGAEEIEISWYYGTPGYRAPEIRSRKRLSAKSDVYSYGKLLYALLSGKEDVEVMPPALVRKKRGVSFKVKVWFLRIFPWVGVLFRRCKLREIEKRLEKRARRSRRQIMQISTALRLVVLCTQLDAAMRPSMERVLMEVEHANVCKIAWAVKAGVAMGFGWYRLLMSFLCFMILLLPAYVAYKSTTLCSDWSLCFGLYFYLLLFVFMWVVYRLLVWTLNYLDELFYWNPDEVVLETKIK